MAFTKALGGAGNWLSDKFNAAGAAVAGAFGLNSDGDKLAELQRRADNLQKVDPVGNADYVAELRKQMLPLITSVSASEKSAADQARTSTSATCRAPSLRPSAPRSRSWHGPEHHRYAQPVADAMSDPDIRRFVSPDVYSSLGRAYDNTSMMARMNAPGVADRQNYEMSLARIRDDGVQDQGLNAARRTELEILRQTGDVVRATTEAQRAYNVQLATAQERADDLARTSKQSLDLIGLSPSSGR